MAALSLPRPWSLSQDMRRLKCADSACLQRSAEDLAPSCAAFLVGSPEPSPGPSSGGVHGFFSMMERDASGAIHRVSGPISGQMALESQRPMMPLGLMPLGLPSFVPPELLSLMRSSMADMRDDDDEDDDDEGPAKHPCGGEIEACKRETGENSREALQRCLLAHFAQLSPECRCFVHHMAGSKATTQQAVAAPPVKVVAPPPLKVVSAKRPLPPPTVAMASRGEHDERVHPLHRLSCLLLAATVFVVSIMLFRACVLACTKPSTKPKRVVMIPPNSGMAMKPMVVTDAEVVQVAQPVELKA